ncbi:DNA polymerase III subunit alpha [Candidatus Woesebacteria bacterium]|nr:DNA polymerase III subunit alpha [Candidatus Woesebacteria bacterium]
MNTKIDSDIQHNKREEVIQYLRTKYGEGFAHIGTFSVSQGRGLFKDICRIMDISFATSNQIAKLIPDSAHYVSVDASMTESVELKALYDTDPQIKEIIDMARDMEGCVKSLGIHAAGIILSDEPITDYAPLFSSKDLPVTQFDAGTMEKIGFNKIDVLSLKTLSVIKQTFEYIKQCKGITLTMEDIPLDDIQAYKIFPAKNTLGIFQLEAQGITEFAAKCNPKTIYDISNVISIYRPGPLNIPGLVPNYIKACNGREVFDFPFPEYNYIFDKTYNFLVYQEQLSRLSMDMCGFSGPKADELRKATAKKDRDALLKLKDDFVNGAVNKGHAANAVSKLFDDLEEFSRYSFNLAHGISYAYLTYFTAYLKTHYPSEFFASCISLEEDPEQKSKYINDARFNGLNVLPPDINLSVDGFVIAKDGSILFGFNGIKGLGPAVVNKIISSRPFNSFGDFLVKTNAIRGVNKRAIESLIHCGALDCFGYKHSCMLKSFEKFLMDLSNNGKDKDPSSEIISSLIKKQNEYFVDDSYPEFPIFEILQNERNLMGIYISGNPFDLIGSIVEEDFYTIPVISNRAIAAKKLHEYVLCEIVKVKHHQTGKGDAMAFVDCKDHEGNLFSMTIFPKVWTDVSSFILVNSYVLAFCEFSHGARGFNILASNIVNLMDRISLVNLNNKSRKFNTISLHVMGVPYTARAKTIFNKITQHEDPEGQACLKLYVDINSSYCLIKSFSIPSVNTDIIRDLNKIPDVYVSKIDA